MAGQDTNDGGCAERGLVAHGQHVIRSHDAGRAHEGCPRRRRTGVGAHARGVQLHIGRRRGGARSHVDGPSDQADAEKRPRARQSQPCAAGGRQQARLQATVSTQLAAPAVVPAVQPATHVARGAHRDGRHGHIHQPTRLERGSQRALKATGTGGHRQGGGAATAPAQAVATLDARPRRHLRDHDGGAGARKETRDAEQRHLPCQAREGHAVAEAPMHPQAVAGHGHGVRARGHDAGSARGRISRMRSRQAGKPKVLVQRAAHLLRLRGRAQAPGGVRAVAVIARAHGSGARTTRRLEERCCGRCVAASGQLRRASKARGELGGGTRARWAPTSVTAAAAVAHAQRRSPAAPQRLAVRDRGGDLLHRRRHGGGDEQRKQQVTRGVLAAGARQQAVCRRWQQLSREAAQAPRLRDQRGVDDGAGAAHERERVGPAQRDNGAPAQVQRAHVERSDGDAQPTAGHDAHAGKQLCGPAGRHQLGRAGRAADGQRPERAPQAAAAAAVAARVAAGGAVARAQRWRAHLARGGAEARGARHEQRQRVRVDVDEAALARCGAVVALVPRKRAAVDAGVRVAVRVGRRRRRDGGRCCRCRRRRRIAGGAARRVDAKVGRVQLPRRQARVAELPSGEAGRDRRGALLGVDGAARRRCGRRRQAQRAGHPVLRVKPRVRRLHEAAGERARPLDDGAVQQRVVPLGARAPRRVAALVVRGGAVAQDRCRHVAVHVRAAAQRAAAGRRRRRARRHEPPPHGGGGGGPPKWARAGARRARGLHHGLRPNHASPVFGIVGLRRCFHSSVTLKGKAFSCPTSRSRSHTDPDSDKLQSGSCTWMRYTLARTLAAVLRHARR